MYKDEVVLFISSKCKICAKTKEAYEEAADRLTYNFYMVNCDSWPELCENKTLPAIQAGYRNTSYYMVEGFESAEEIVSFVDVMKKTITTSYPTMTKAVDNFENSGIKSYFIFRGPE